MNEGVRIIGIGSPSGDDRAGWELINRLSARLGGRSEVELIAMDRPGTGLIDYLSGQRACWLVDAVKSDDPPGCYLQPEVDQLLQAGSATAGSHGVGLAETLNLAGVLGLLPKRLELHCITISTADIVSEQLSPAVDAGVDGLVQRFLERLEKHVVHTATFKGGVGSFGSSSGSSACPSAIKYSFIASATFRFSPGKPVFPNRRLQLAKWACWLKETKVGCSYSPMHAG